MIMEIIIGVIGIAFILLVIFLIMTLLRLRRFIKTADRVLTKADHLLHAISEPTVELIQNSNKLVMDVKKKSEALDVIFRPLYCLKKERSEEPTAYKKISEILELVIEGVQLFSKIKKEMK